MPSVLSQAEDYLITNLWWLILLWFLFACLLGFVVYLVLRKKVRVKRPSFSKTAYTDALGGEDNILSHELRGSRIVLRLKDYKAIDPEKIKEAGVTGFIEKSDQLTLVVKDHADKVYDLLFNVRS